MDTLFLAVQTVCEVVIVVVLILDRIRPPTPKTVVLRVSEVEIETGPDGHLTHVTF